MQHPFAIKLELSKLPLVTNTQLNNVNSFVMIYEEILLVLFTRNGSEFSVYLYAANVIFYFVSNRLSTASHHCRYS
jgi:hypothetical protein